MLNKKLTEHEHGLEDSKYCSDHYAVLRGGKKVAITGRPDTNWTQNKNKSKPQNKIIW